MSLMMLKGLHTLVLEQALVYGYRFDQTNHVKTPERIVGDIFAETKDSCPSLISLVRSFLAWCRRPRSNEWHANVPEEPLT
jgi:hypothetical protein